ncbi:MAG: MTH938/NDUFAF3 family protein [Burkholderiales bacterium]|nr:MTH938/NDUFAF3 family protein [Burkholderiales bacterium]
MAMQLLREATSEFAITGYTAASVTVGGVEHSRSVCLSHRAPVAPWPVASFEDVDVAAVAQAVAAGADIVLIGTGRTLRFPKPEVLRPLREAQMGYEIMDTGAACRTFNVLLGEGRQVAALLLFEP